MLGLVRTLDRYADIVGLFFRKLRKLHTEVIQMQPGNLLVQMFRKTIHSHLQFLLPQLDLRQTLVSERIAHHERRMSRSAPQIHQATFGQDKDRMAVEEGELIHLRFDVGTHGIRSLKTGHLDFVIEMADVETMA